MVTVWTARSMCRTVGNELLGLGVGHGLVPRRALLQALEESDFLLRGVSQFDLDAPRPGGCVVLGLGELFIVLGRDIVEEALHPFGHLVLVCGWLLRCSGLDGFQVDADRVGEGSRGREQPFLQQQGDQVDGGAAPFGREPAAAERGELIQ